MRDLQFQGQQIVVVGLGQTGRACVDFLLQQGVAPRVIDSRNVPLSERIFPAEVKVHVGSWQEEWLQRADMVIISPGVPLATPALQHARAAGVEIISDIELFGRLATAPIVAITGTNGKSTVATLVGAMAQAAGWNVQVGGNIGVPALRLLQHPADLYVLELSSFQLEATFNLPIVAAAVLNMTPDHLDRYAQKMTDYHAAKQRIYNQAQWCIFNNEDDLTWPVKTPTTAWRTFGLESGDYRVQLQQGESWLTAYGKPLLPVQQIPLIGWHHAANALAAVAVADSVSIPRTASLQALQAFPGLPHRLQLVCHRGGVQWINDSKATNVGSTIAALQGLTIQRHLHLLLGGKSKEADFTPLIPYLQREHLRVYCFGQAASELAKLSPMATQCDTLAEAMQLISQRVQPGDTVLLSPACASFDQFSNFVQRGEYFMQLAQALAR